MKGSSKAELVKFIKKPVNKRLTKQNWQQICTTFAK